MWFVDNQYGIGILEVVVLVVVVWWVSKRLTGTKASVDIDRIEAFLTNIDDETLFRIADMDKRHEGRDTIRQDIDIIHDNTEALRKAIDEAGTVQEIHTYVQHITSGYLNIIKAINAISTRECLDLRTDRDSIAQTLITLQESTGRRRPRE